MSSILKDLAELVENNVISAQTARAIEDYYAEIKGRGSSQLVIFGALGAILVGLGIILIFAHNWDNFSRSSKTLLAFFPLVLSQMAAGYSILKNKGSLWKEVSGTLLFFSVGASMALISQIYNIPGEESSFVLTWTLLCLPLIYLLRSNTLAVLHLAFSTIYAVEAGYFNPKSPWLYLVLILVLLPFYRQHLKENRESFASSMLNWLIPLSLTIALGAFISGADEFGFVIYIALLCLFYNVGLLPFFSDRKQGWNGWLNLGRTGIALLLLATSFRWFWKAVAAAPVPKLQFVLVWAAFLLVGIFIAYKAYKDKKYRFDWYQLVVVIFPLIYFIGMSDDFIPAILNNALVLGLGIAAIKEGAERVNFSTLNFGLIIISGLVIARFFDTNISFAVRGLLFIAVGAGFFLANYLVIKKKRNNSANTLSR